MGYMGISTAFVLFPWGRVTRGHPVKWLLHITGGQPQPDPEAAEMQPGSSFTLERKPGGVTWELGGLPPKIALQYYYDWGHMQGTGAIYGRLPRSYTAPPSKWEEMGANLIPSPQSERQPPPNPNFWCYQQQEETQTTGGASSSTDRPHEAHPSPWPSPTPAGGPSPSPRPTSTMPTRDGHDGTDSHTNGEEEEPEQAHFMQRRTQLESRASSSSHGPRVLDTTYTPLMSNAAAMLRRWLRELAALLRDHPMGEQIPLLLERAMVAISKNKDEDEPNNSTGGYPRPCKKRRILNMIEIARRRLQDLADDDGEDGYNTHQIRASLEESLRGPRQGGVHLQPAHSQTMGGPSATRAAWAGAGQSSNTKSLGRYNPRGR